MEDIAEEAAKPILRLLYYLCRVLLWLVDEVGFHLIGWSIGWAVLRVITWGYFPKVSLLEQHKAPSRQAILTQLLGIAVLVVSVYGLDYMIF